MNKEELWRELDEKGIEYDKRWKSERLIELLGKEKEAIKAVEELEDTFKKREEVADKVVRKDDGTATFGNGILEIPQDVLSNLKPTQWHYYVSNETEEYIEISKISKAERIERVRDYSLSIHGEKFKELAKQFIGKFNK